MPIRLYKFGAIWGLPDPSPFCVKLENFLRATNIAYEVVPFDRKRTFAKAPKGKVPFIEEEDGTLVGDSSLIIERLSHRFGLDLDANLDPRQRSTSHAFRRMLDEHLYWVAVYSRWFDEPGWSVTRAAFFGRLSAPIRPLLTAVVRRKMARALHAQGVGRHSRDVVYRLGSADLVALSRLLGDDPYYFGTQQPGLLDLWSHAFIGELIIPPIETPLKAAARGLPNLCDHFHRLHARLYPA